HGVGLLIHEAPWINPRSLDVLCENDVVTVEPGAYRMGLGGVRVEDLFIVTSAGHFNISRSPKIPYSTLNV
ncbi:M24 family metallopeptidase, partial [bacterium]|nr:M24 family metallopeptidase [bacterium]